MMDSEKNIQDILEIVSFIKDNAASKSDVIEIKKDISVIKTDVSELKTDVSGLKTDVSGLKTDVSGLKTDVSGLKHNVGTLAVKIVSIDEKIDTLPTRENFSDLQTAVDNYAKKSDNYFQEMVVLNNKVNRLEKWILELASKVNVKLEY